MGVVIGGWSPAIARERRENERDSIGDNKGGRDRRDLWSQYLKRLQQTISVCNPSQTFKILRLNVISVANLVAMFAITCIGCKSVSKVVIDEDGRKSRSPFHYFLFFFFFLKW